MKKILSVFCAIVLVLTTVIIAVPSAVAEVIPPEGQDASLASTIICSSKPTTIMNYATNSQRRSIASISKLTANESMRALGFKTYNGFDSTMNSTHHVAAFDFPEGTVTNINGGYMLYLDLPVLNSYEDKDVPIPHDIAIQRHSTAGTVLSHTQCLGGKNDTIPWYVLPDGEDEWQAKNEWVVKASSPYALRISDGTKPFRGYVYIPATLLQKNGYVDKDGQPIGAISFTVDVDRKTYGGSGDGRGSERGVAPIDVSAVTLISSFNADTTCVYNDKGEIVDLAAKEENKNYAELPYWEDENGYPVELHGTADKIPSNISKDNFSLTANTSKLPLTSLFSYTLPEGKDKTNGYIKLSETISTDTVKGAIFYVEIPDFKTVSYAHEDGVIHTTDKFRFALNFAGYEYVRNSETGLYEYNTDGSIKTKNKTFLTYGSPDWYIRGVDDSEWRQSGDRTYYGVGLPSGFKGYVCVPFNALTQNNYSVSTDSFITGVTLLQLTNSASVVFRDDHNTNVPEYGYIPDDKPLIVSAPIWMSGNYMDGADEFTASDEITINGVDYNYSTGKVVDYSEHTYPNVSTAIKTDSSTSGFAKNISSVTGYGSIDKAYGLSALTDDVGSVVTSRKLANLSGYSSVTDATAAYRFKNDISLSSGGFIMRVELPSVQGDHIIAFSRIGGDGKVNWSQVTASDGMTWYYLPDGEKEWKSEVSPYLSYDLDFNDMSAETGYSPAFSGYVYFPGTFFRNNTGAYTLREIGVGVQVYRTTYGNDDYVNEALKEPINISAITHVTSFNSATTLAYGDDGRLVDLATGVLVLTEYNVADEFLGNAELINSGDNDVLKVSQKATIHPDIPFSAFNDDTTNATYSIVKSPVTLEAPLYKLNVENSDSSVTRTAFSYNYKLKATDDEGLMFYVNNASSADFECAFASTFYPTMDYTPETSGTQFSDGSYYKYVNFSASSVKFLNEKTEEWEELKTTSNYIKIPSGAKGYVYISFNNFGLGDLRAEAYSGKLAVRSKLVVGYSGLEIGAPAYVEHFTTNYAGTAFVNGGTVAQNLFDGSFTVPNDSDGDMRLDLLDLVRAKENQNASEFSDFRNSYLENYYREEKAEEEYTPVTYSNNLRPLYADEYNALSDNPDRGYRTEMVIGIQERLDEGESSDARNLYTTDSEAKIRETMNQIFEIYFPTNAEYHSKLAIAFISFKDWNKSEYLPDEVLKILEIYFEYCRKYEIRLLLRFTYGVPTNLYIANAADREKLEKVCADEATMIRHIKQLAPFVAKHRDVVHKISSGWIGNGEMVASFQWPAVNFDNVVRAVVEEMCVPNNLYFTVRLPRYKVNMLNNYKAETGKDYPYADIIGFNNDAIYGEQTHAGHNSGCYQYNHTDCGRTCFLKDENYFDEWQYAIKTAAYTPQCGEMFTNQNLFETDRVPAGFEVMLEMAHHRYTGFSQWHGYLDTSGYKTDNSNVFSSWINNENYYASDIEDFGIIYDPNSFVEADGTEITLNPYEYLRDHLGYKLVADNSTLNWSGNHNDSATVSLSFKNYGFAAPFNLESGFAILDEDYNVITKVQEGNPDKWYSLDPDFYTEEYEQTGTVLDNVLNYELNATISLPKESGKYYVAFYLQNAMGEGARLSNDLVFEKEFNILHEITVE